MKLNTRKPNRYVFSSAALVLALSFIGAYAYGELKEYSDMDGRSYHAEMHEKGRCRTCHGMKEPKGYPEDGSCLRCHEVEELVAATMPEEEEDRWQNPHDNLHYGADVPCVECHGEHTNKAPLCANCHNFDYQDHKY